MRIHICSFSEAYYYTQCYNNKYKMVCVLAAGYTKRFKSLCLMVQCSVLPKVFIHCLMCLTVDKVLITNFFMSKGK